MVWVADECVGDEGWGWRGSSKNEQGCGGGWMTDDYGENGRKRRVSSRVEVHPGCTLKPCGVCVGRLDMQTTALFYPPPPRSPFPELTGQMRLCCASHFRASGQGLPWPLTLGVMATGRTESPFWPHPFSSPRTSMGILSAAAFSDPPLLIPGGVTFDSTCKHCRGN